MSGKACIGGLFESRTVKDMYVTCVPVSVPLIFMFNTYFNIVLTSMAYN